MPPVNTTYQLLDSGYQRKLEQVGKFRIIRPAAGAVWKPRLAKSEWQKADSEFRRKSESSGIWQGNKKLPASWKISIANTTIVIKPTDFGHLGIFIEQKNNWLMLQELLKDKANNKYCKILNLFAYTGIASLACSHSYTEVVHLDASKTSVEWAKENATAAQKHKNKIRFIVDDVQKFVAREVRRNSKYQGIILDPPSFGRGPKGQTWKIEDDLIPLLTDIKKLLAPDFKFFLLSAHSQAYTPQALLNITHDLKLPEGKYSTNEMTVSEKVNKNQNKRLLPAGACCFYLRAGN